MAILFKVNSKFLENSWIWSLHRESELKTDCFIFWQKFVRSILHKRNMRGILKIILSKFYIAFNFWNLLKAQILKSLPPILQSVQINIKEPFIGKLIQDSNLLWRKKLSCCEMSPFLQTTNFKLKCAPKNRLTYQPDGLFRSYSDLCIDHLYFTIQTTEKYITAIC